MSDRRKYCRVRGDIEKCEATQCGNRESWYVRELQKKLAEAQAKIDALMLEHCPDEMTLEQIEEWSKHQRPVKERGSSE